MGKHYVPQKYLQAWQALCKCQYIWQYDKKQGRCCDQPLPISKVAQGGVDFYSTVDEAELFPVERQGNAVLGKLRSHDFNLTEMERVYLALYLATLLRRVPAYRQFARDEAPKQMEEMFSELRDDILRNARTAGWSPEELDRQLRLLEVDRAETTRSLDAVSEPS